MTITGYDLRDIRVTHELGRETQRFIQTIVSQVFAAVDRTWQQPTTQPTQCLAYYGRIDIRCVHPFDHEGEHLFGLREGDLVRHDDDVHMRKADH